MRKLIVVVAVCGALTLAGAATASKVGFLTTWVYDPNATGAVTS